MRPVSLDSQALLDDPPATQLLVSVRDDQEARIAYESGVRWIDLKDPAAGSLGCPNIDTARSFRGFFLGKELGTAENHIELTTSSALGELIEPADNRLEVASLFRWVKLGLAGCQDRPDWSTQLGEFCQKLKPETAFVVVFYADFQRARSPGLDEVIAAAEQLGSRMLLVDTWKKDGTNLLSYGSATHWQSLKEKLQERGIGLALAGSLDLDAIDELLPIQPRLLAVRGAACLSGRESGISPSKITQLLKRIHFAMEKRC